VLDRRNTVLPQHRGRRRRTTVTQAACRTGAPATRQIINSSCCDSAARPHRDIFVSANRLPRRLLPGAHRRSLPTCQSYACFGLMRVWIFGNTGGDASACTDCVEVSRIVQMLEVVKGSVVSSGRRENTHHQRHCTATSIPNPSPLLIGRPVPGYPRRQETAVLRY
jgi:hypothetical protein